MDMRKSRVLAKMRAGKVATCVKLNLTDARVAEIAAMCGFDCIWLDQEHVPNDYMFIENAVRAGTPVISSMRSTTDFSLFERSSAITTLYPASISSTAVWEPMKPVPPVSKTLIDTSHLIYFRSDEDQRASIMARYFFPISG